MKMTAEQVEAEQAFSRLQQAARIAGLMCSLTETEDPDDLLSIEKLELHEVFALLSDTLLSLYSEACVQREREGLAL